MSRRTSTLTGLLLLAALSQPTEAAFVNSYVEDFASWEYRDVATTTANWDTLAGEIGLFPFQLTEAGSCPCVSFRVAVDGDHAFVADNSGALNVIDIGDPANPSVVGSYSGFGDGFDVALDGDHAYVTDSNEGLLIIDISDPSAPYLAGRQDTPGTASGVALSGDYAFVADYTSGVQVIDILSSASPFIYGTVGTPGPAYDVAVSGDYAFVADGSGGLHVLDISDPQFPSIAGSASTTTAFAVAVAGDYAYVGGSLRLDVVDISDPPNPVCVANLSLSYSVYDVALSGDRAYLASMTGGLVAVDITDPTNPVTVNDITLGGAAFGVDVAGEYAFVTGSGLKVVRVAQVTQPLSLASLPTPGHPLAVTIDGNHAFIADSDGGLTVADISNPQSPLVDGQFDSPSNFVDVAIEGNYAFVAMANPLPGLGVIDITDPTAPFGVAEYATPGNATAVAVSGNYAYLVDDSGQLQSFDISDPENPQFVDAVPLGGGLEPEALVVAGDYAFVGHSGAGGIEVVDISDPEILASVLTGAPFRNTYGLAVSGDYLYAASSFGLDVYDITDPSTMIGYVANYGLPEDAHGVAVEGDRVFVADEEGGLYLFDVGDPADPHLVASYDTPSWAHDVTVSGDNAFVADEEAGLQIVGVFERLWNLDDNTVRSTDITQDDSPATWVRIETSQTDSIRWDVSTREGVVWESVPQNGEWHELLVHGGELLWRSLHYYTVPEVNAACTDLRIDWLYDFPVIESIADVGNDQGRQVRISWARSGEDRLGNDEPITEYAIYRRVDELPLCKRADVSMGDGVARRASLAADCASSGGRPTDRLAPKDALDRGLRYPPGDWDFVTTVPARTEDEYSTVVPTLADSTISEGMYYSVFFVSALTATPGVFFDSPPDSGYSIDNLAPHVPTGFVQDWSPDQSHLSWDESIDEDFQYFRIYRSEDPGFIPSPEDLVHVTTDLEWTDVTGSRVMYYYKITAVDFSGNESDAASPETTTGAVDAVAAAFALHQNVPNPVRATTTIQYDVPVGGGRFSLEIFDAAGRLVRRLVEGLQDEGRHSAIWDTRDESGLLVASGVYYCRMTANGRKAAVKVIVVR